MSYLISFKFLNASLAQRITRKICENCKEYYSPSPEIVENIKQVLGPVLPAKYGRGEPMQIARGKGCQECNFSGYLGRIAIFEVLKITPAINKLILKASSAKDIEEQARCRTPLFDERLQTFSIPLNFAICLSIKHFKY